MFVVFGMQATQKLSINIVCELTKLLDLSTNIIASTDVIMSCTQLLNELCSVCEVNHITSIHECCFVLEVCSLPMNYRYFGPHYLVFCFVQFIVEVKSQPDLLVTAQS